MTTTASRSDSPALRTEALAPTGAEARWFTQHDVARPAGRCQVRVDAYHLGSLTPTSAWKQRALRHLEHKRLLAAEPIEVCGVLGRSEQWSKERGRHVAPDAAPDLAGPWLVVVKERWRSPGLEVARLSIGDELWWTLAVSIPARGAAPRHLVERHRTASRIVATSAFAGSYPAWIERYLW
jgi:hypothetical protein